jgi:hypothetical protein
MVTCVGRGSSIQARRYLKLVAMVIHGHSTWSRVVVHSQAICQRLLMVWMVFAALFVRP